MDRRTALSTIVVLAVTTALITGLIVRQADTGSSSSTTDARPLPDPVPLDESDETSDESDESDESDGTSDDPDPLPGDDSQSLEEFVPEAIGFIEGERGRPFLETPVVVALSDADFVARVDADLEAEFAENPDDVEMYNAFYRAFGLIRPDESIDQVYRAFGAAGILGFYDPESGELVVRQVDELSLLTKSTIVHELTHAYDDQHYDLDRPEYDDLIDEVPWTFSAVVEGSASYLEARWEETLGGSERAALLQEELAFGDPSVLLQFELAFLWLELSVYESGEAFAASVVDRDGFDRLGELLLDPPTTSEQVIDPSALAAGEVGSGVAPPPADGDVVNEGVGGQVLLESLFAGAGLDFVRGSDGWGDDRFVIWLEGDLTCLRWDLQADTAVDLDELEQALDRWIAGGAGVISQPATDTLRVDRCV